MPIAPRSLKDLFLEALAVPPARRQSWLAEECAHDADLRRQVELMLAAHDAPQSLLDRAAPPQPVALAPVTQPYDGDLNVAGTTVGPYKLLQQIGEGGMGTVFMAEQTRPVERRVALKIIKPGMDTRQVIARFEAERQALAMMDHPNIAKVLDAGATDSGRPYFVMELVRGIPITKYCDEHQLTLRRRLELFLPVCQAVQHAHQKGIIHRDLKPSNVLVAQYDDKPVPKVIDFGVAKAAQKLTDRTMFTEFGQVIGTLEYMSPEQATFNQLDIDTRSDIYSLGVLLYELLTGCTPFDGKRLRSAAFDEMLRIIREEEPPKPSTRLSSAETLPSIAANRNVEPAKLGRSLRGELDWIVMKALEKDRNRRYETTNGLARDIERFLHDEPVQACPPSAAYRFRKFARRNTRALASGALAAFAILAIAATLGWAVRDREAHAQKEAQERSERHAAVEREVSLALQEAEQFQEQSKWSDALSAAKRAQGLLAGGGGEESRKRADELRKDLELVLRLEENRAQQWSEYSFDHDRRNRAYARVFTESGIDLELSPPEVAAQIVRRPATAVRMAAALDEWAQLLRDWGLRDRTLDTSEWKRLLEIAQIADPDPWRNQLRQLIDKEDLDALRKLAAESDIAALPVQSLLLMGSALAISGDGPACVAWLRKAHQQHPDDAMISFDLAFHLTQPPSQWAEALRFGEAALAAQPSPSMYDMVGITLGAVGRYDEAAACHGKAVELKPDSVSSHIFLGNSFKALGKLDEALDSYRRADRLLSDESRDLTTAGSAIARRLSGAYGEIGDALCRVGHLSEAVAAFDKATKLDPDNHWFHFLVAALCLKLGDTEGYRNACCALLECAEKVAVDDPVVAERAAKTCSLAPQSVSDFSRVERVAEFAVTETEAHQYYRYFVLAKGLTEYRTGRYEEAIEWFIRFKPKFNGEHIDSSVFAGMAMAQHRLGRTQQAKESWFNALMISTQKMPDPTKGRPIAAHDVWIDWFHCAIVCEEAKKLLGGLSAEEMATARLAHLGANCEDFFTLAGVHASRKDVERAQLWLAAGDLRLERYCGNVQSAKRLREQAVSALQEAGASPPNEPESASDLLQRFNEILAADPEAAWAYELRGQLYAGTGEGEKAETDYRCAFDLLAKRGGISKDDPEQVRSLAEGAIARRQWGLSVAAYERLLELRVLGKWPKPWLGPEWPNHERGFAYYWMLDYERAEAEYTKGIELSPGFAGIWARRGSIRVAKGEYDQAIEDYAIATKLQPDHPPDWQWNGYLVALQQRGKRSEAAAELQRVRKGQPQNVNVAYQQALSLLGAGDMNRYRNVCQEMTQQFGSTSDMVTAYWVAWTCGLGPGALDDLGPVIALAEKAASAEPDNLQYLTTLGALLYRAGRWKDAIERLSEVDRRLAEPSEAAASSPAYVWLFLAMAHHRLGNEKEAAMWHAKASQYAAQSPAANTTPWYRTLTLRLLLQETSQMMEQISLPTD